MSNEQIPRPVPSAGIVRWEESPWSWHGVGENGGGYQIHKETVAAVLRGEASIFSKVILPAFGPCEHGGQWTLLEDREREVEARELVHGMRWVHNGHVHLVIARVADRGWCVEKLDACPVALLRVPDETSKVIIREPGGRELHACDDCVTKQEERDLANARLSFACQRCGSTGCYEEECRALEVMDDADYAHPGSGKLIKAAPIEKPALRTYQIPAREVVEGMTAVINSVSGVVHRHRIEKARREHGWVALYAVGHKHGLGWWSGDELVGISLPGPSPRELCCVAAGICAKHLPWVPTAGEPVADHHPACPVAPRPGVHGGMRLWPAPWACGRLTLQPWKRLPCVGAGEYMHPYLPSVDAEELRWLAEQTAFPGHSEALLRSFFLPPTPIPEPDRRPPVDVDPELACAFARWR